jgi:hypothetical protein
MYNIFKYFATSFVKLKNVDKCLTKLDLIITTKYYFINLNK